MLYLPSLFLTIAVSVLPNIEQVEAEFRKLLFLETFFLIELKSQLGGGGGGGGWNRFLTPSKLLVIRHTKLCVKWKINANASA
jgi:hypothetical protein